MTALTSGIEADLRVEPTIAEFPAEGGGASRHLLINFGSNRIAVKAKCSDNFLYRVTPVHTILDPGQAERLHILRDPGPARVDKLVLLYADASTAVRTAGVSRDARTIFACTTTQDEKLLRRERINLVAKQTMADLPEDIVSIEQAVSVQVENAEIAELTTVASIVPMQPVVVVEIDRWKCEAKRNTWAKLFR